MQEPCWRRASEPLSAILPAPIHKATSAQLPPSQGLTRTGEDSGRGQSHSARHSRGRAALRRWLESCMPRWLGLSRFTAPLPSAGGRHAHPRTVWFIRRMQQPSSTSRSLTRCNCCIRQPAGHGPGRGLGQSWCGFLPGGVWGGGAQAGLGEGPPATGIRGQGRGTSGLWGRCRDKAPFKVT